MELTQLSAMFHLSPSRNTTPLLEWLHRDVSTLKAYLKDTEGGVEVQLQVAQEFIET